MTNHPYIDASETLIEAIKTDPQRIVDTLARGYRFANQHPTSSILRHSVEVYDLTSGDPCSDRRTWALLHDLHEVVTGDQPLAYKAETITYRQVAIDLDLQRAFGLNLSSTDVADIESIDRAVGKFEYAMWDAYPYQSSVEAARLIYLDRLIEIARRVS